MKKKERYEIKETAVYRLISVTDKEGNDKVHERRLYEERIGCLATDFVYDDMGRLEGCRLHMRFVEDEDGKPISRRLRTSPVSKVEETETGITLYTYNSIYVFENAELKEPTYAEEALLTELYLSTDEDYYFCKGFYYDEEKYPHELLGHIHVGMFQDSVLVSLQENAMDTVCLFFPYSECIVFYDTIYGQQDYSVPILIHNVGKSSFQVEFEDYPCKWTIKPDESKRIIPYTPTGADKEEE